MASRVIKVSKIYPSFSNSLLSKFSLPLSEYDRIFVKFPPVERLLFYPLPNDSHSLFESTIISNLKHSLSLTLQHFYPLAGVLVWPNDSPLPFIRCSRNDAVSFALAESVDDDFHTLSSPDPLELSHFKSLLPPFHSHSNSSIPMFSTQVTHFPNHGYSIGISNNHVIADGYSFNLFLKSWAHICNKLNHNSQPYSPTLPCELLPSFDRDNMNSNSLQQIVPNNIDRNLSYNLKYLVPSDWQRATFDVTPNHIVKLKRRALEYWTKLNKNNELHLSTFVVVYAHALVCLAKAKGDACKDKFYVMFVANGRSTLAHDANPISTNYFGNCVVRMCLVVESRELRDEENGFSMVAKKIGDLILKLKEKGGIDEINNNSLHLKEILKSVDDFEVCSVAGSPKYKSYEIDFGWGKPKQIEMASLVRNNFHIIDSRDGDGGVQLGLILPTHQMKTFSSLFLKGFHYKNI